MSSPVPPPHRAVQLFKRAPELPGKHLQVFPNELAADPKSEAWEQGEPGPAPTRRHRTGARRRGDVMGHRCAPKSCRVAGRSLRPRAARMAPQTSHSRRRWLLRALLCRAVGAAAVQAAKPRSTGAVTPFSVCPSFPPPAPFPPAKPHGALGRAWPCFQPGVGQEWGTAEAASHPAR